MVSPKTPHSATDRPRVIPENYENQKLGNFDQGQNRTIDTRIFKTAGCLFRLKKAEET